MPYWIFDLDTRIGVVDSQATACLGPLARARELYAAMNAGVFDKGSELFSDSLVFHTPVFPEPLRGIEAPASVGRRILDTTDEYRLEPHDILANDDHVVALVVVRGRRGDRVLNELGVHVMHLDEEGKVAELWAVTDPKPHLALWGEA